ncbi:MAG: DUF1501 domain-containing protein [Planctomycetota bacterium]|nr:DUF1501 domain-containing protein [Planctomycetota bacterium]MEE3364625.1 DUF1501 domain-containing protein [Planctomycetota bacterium]
MLTVPGSTYRNCDGLSRRNFLQVGAPLLGLGLSSLLEHEATADDETRDRGKSLIVFWTHGGMSQQDTYDMKPDSPAEYRGPYRPIKTNVPGTIVGERFARQARVMDKIAQVRSVHHENGIHAPSAHWMQTGYFGPTLARIAAQYPSFGSVINKALGARSPHMPAYIAVPKAEAFGYQKSVYLGASFDPFEVGADPNSKNFKVPNLALPGGLELANVRKRRDLLTRFDSLRRDIDRTGVMDGLDAFKAKALEMVTGEEVRKAFEIDSEPDALRARYGRHQYGQSALLARRLVESGARVVTVNTGYWDHHNDVHPNLEQHLPPLDAAMATLLEDLDERGMLDNTLVYCAGEFGRTPLINGHAGRDHWSNCFTVMLAGGGIVGGRNVGASERHGGGVLERPSSPLDVLATIYDVMGISLGTHYEDASGRPVSIVGSGRPIHELT